MIEDLQSGFWIVAVTERAIRVVAAMIYEKYDKYRLWWLPLDIIGFARQPGMRPQTCPGPTRNVHDALKIVGVIE